MRMSVTRTLVILICGFVMALVAYVGQAGDAPANASVHETRPVGETIRQVVVNGLRLDYRLVAPARGHRESASAAAPELLLYLSGSVPDGPGGAIVTYRILGPRGTELQAWARSGRGGYEADVQLDFPGRYRIATEIILAGETFNDHFDYSRP